MAIIPLRQYNRDIEGMIENGQFPEAIAHCRHILSTYPKNVQTYRLLGKLFLETQQYADATDIFQRLLVVIPEDFIAHVGMSIIREDENNLEAAIWHMERAFETQPANAAIQEELRRLYGRRDGMEPPKIRLTRGALARMYARGNLSEQAIAELRAALSDDPQRVDLQVLLAQMYYQTRQHIEAINICSVILKKYPYCQEANRLLAIILPETDRSQDAEIYRQRLRAMDPYYAKASPTALTTDEVPENAVTIERLAYQAGATFSGMPDQPAWASALGIAFTSKASDKIPEWLHENEGLIPPTVEEPKPPVVAPFSWEKPVDVIPEAPDSSQQEDVIPEWMQEAGWGPSDEAVKDSAVPSEFDGSEGEIAKGEIPDWLRNMAPQGVLDEEQLPPEDEKEDIAMPWLHEKEPGASDTITNWLNIERPEEPSDESENIQTAPAIGLPAWLYANARETSEDEEKLSPGLDDEQLPPWLNDLEKPVEGPSGVTDWLRTATLPEEPMATDSEQEYPEPIDLPDWLEEAPVVEEAKSESLEVVNGSPEIVELSDVQELETGISEPHESSDASPLDQTHIIDDDAAFAWLENLAAQQGAKAEELITPSNEQLTTPPDWVLSQDTSEPPSAEAPVLPAPAEIPAWLQDLEPAENILELPATPESEIDHELPTQSLPEWLKETEQIAEEPSEAFLSDNPEASKVSEIPEWLRAAAIAEGITSIVNDESKESEQLPEWLRDLGTEETEIPAAIVDLPTAEEEVVPIDMPVWLRETGEVEDLAASTDQIIPDGVEAGIPDWLPEAEVTLPEPPPPSDLAQASVPLDVNDQDAALDWLERLAAEQGVDEEELITRPEDRLETPPDWVLEGAESEAQSEIIQVTEQVITPEWDEPDIRSEGEPLFQQEESSVQITQPEVEEELPAWLQEETTLIATIEPGDAVQGEELPPWLQEETVVQPLQAPEEIFIAEELPVFLEEEPPLAISQATEESVQGEELTLGLQPEVASLTPEVASLTPEVASLTPEVALDIEPVNINTASLGELERLPGIGFVLAQNILAYRTEQGTITSVDELLSIEGFTPGTVDAIRNVLIIEAVEAPQAIPSPAPLSDAEMILASARQAMETGQSDTAIKEYSKLVKKSIQLDTIIQELHDALYHHPLDFNIWQLLGDAYMRNMNLQQALEAYIKAEDLLR